MRKLKVLVLVITGLLLTFSVRAQFIYGPTASYQYQKGSAIKVGAYAMTDVSINALLRADLTGNLTWTQGKFAVIPELAVSYYWGSPNGYFLIPLFVRTEVTPYTVVPKLGISFLTVVDLDFGYAVSTRDKKDYLPIKGFTGSVRFSFPLNL